MDRPFRRMKNFVKGMIHRHKNIHFINFTTHMLGKLFMGLGIGLIVIGEIKLYAIIFLASGLMLHIPWWRKIYFVRN